MRKPIVGILCALGLVGAGCSTTVPSTTMETLKAPIPVATNTRTVSWDPPVPSSTPSPLPVSIPSPTATALQQKHSNQCPDILSEMPVDDNRSGLVLYENRGDVRSVHLLDMKTGNITIIPERSDEGMDWFSFSPDRNWGAYVHCFTGSSVKTFPSEIVIFDRQGKETHKIPQEPGWIGIGRWLDNQHFLIGNTDHQAKTIDPILILNPFTGEKTLLRPDLPDFYFAPTDYEQGFIFGPMVDPKITRIVYPRETNGWFNEIALKDLLTGQVLASPRGDITVPPVWSPAGDRLLFVSGTYYNEDSGYWGSEELFTMDMDGNTTQLTHYSEMFSKYQFGNYYSWSPDGQKIAFWAATDPLDVESTRFRLSLLDLSTGETIENCIPGMWGGLTFPPIWSPDGQYLLVDSEGNGENDNRAILVSMNKTYAVEIAKKVDPLGWMTGP
jgi:hypothetical protein